MKTPSLVVLGKNNKAVFSAILLTALKLLGISVFSSDCIFLATRRYSFRFFLSAVIRILWFLQYGTRRVFWAETRGNKKEKDQKKALLQCAMLESADAHVYVFLLGKCWIRSLLAQLVLWHSSSRNELEGIPLLKREHGFVPEGSSTLA